MVHEAHVKWPHSSCVMGGENLWTEIECRDGLYYVKLLDLDDGGDTVQVGTTYAAGPNEDWARRCGEALLKGERKRRALA